jgi:hypothetical protein
MARNKRKKDDNKGKKEEDKGKKDEDIVEAMTSEDGARKGLSWANKSKGKNKRQETKEETDKIDVNTSTFGEDSDSKEEEEVPSAFKCMLASKVV